MVVTLLVLALAGCGGSPADDAPTDDSAADTAGGDTASTPVELVPAAPDALLTRISLDLRGIRPSLAEQDEVAAAADPTAAIDALTAAWLHDPRFGDQVASLYADVLLTRQDAYTITAHDFGFAEEAPLMQAVGAVPVRMVARIADEDLPWTDAVAGDWTLADELLASVFPVDYPEGAEGWQVVRWTDGRPAAGILATNSLWWRYTTTESNAQRGRANAVSRMFLCNDYLQQTITFDRSQSLVDEEAVRAALTTSPECVSCHVSLDPLAAHFFGFQYRFDWSPYERSVYHPEREDQWQIVLQVPPGYYGQPSDDLYDLGRHIAADQRYARCAVQTVYGGLLRRAVTLADEDALVRHRDSFIAGGATLRALVASIVADPVYRAEPSDDSPLPTRRLVRPDQLASVVEELTGVRMAYDDWDLLRSDLYGYRILAGGIDGVNATATPAVPTPTLLLVHERLAEIAAASVVSADAALAPDDRRLLGPVDFDQRPDGDSAAMSESIQRLALRILGHRWQVDGPEVAALLELWGAVFDATGDSPQAWTAVVTALLRDPAFLVY